MVHIINSLWTHCFILQFLNIVIFINHPGAIYLNFLTSLCYAYENGFQVLVFFRVCFYSL